MKDFAVDFDRLQALQARARRERSEAIYEMLIAPLVQWFFGVKEQKRATHAPRPHFAR
jgi:hypothetical protein